MGEFKGGVGLEGKVVRTISKDLPQVSSLRCHKLLLKLYFVNTLALPLLFICFFSDIFLVFHLNFQEIPVGIVADTVSKPVR